MKWAIVTPSYKLDFEQCRLLCESLDLFAEGNWHHYIIVGKIDQKLFSTLASDRRSVLLESEVLPSWLHFICKFGKLRSGNLYFSWRTGPMFGWHLQQILKLSIAHRLSEDAMLMCDSDMFLIKHIKLSDFHKNDKLRFFRSTNMPTLGAKAIPAFGINSRHSLGLSDIEGEECDYVENMIVWHRQTVVDMCHHLEKLHRKNWIAAIYGYRLLSEYTLYGMFVEHIATNKLQFEFQDFCICKTVHYGPVLNAEQIEEFFSTLEPKHVAVGFQSNIGFAIETLRPHFERLKSA